MKHFYASQASLYDKKKDNMITMVKRLRWCVKDIKDLNETRCCPSLLILSNMTESIQSRHTLGLHMFKATHPPLHRKAMHCSTLSVPRVVVLSSPHRGQQGLSGLCSGLCYLSLGVVEVLSVRME